MTESSQLLFWNQMLTFRFLRKQTEIEMHGEILLGDTVWDDPLHISTCGRDMGSRTHQVENANMLQSQLGS